MSGSTRSEMAVAAFLVAFGGLVVALARQIGPGIPTDPLGPQAFPTALGAGIALCGLLLAGATLLLGGPRGPAVPLTGADPEEDAGLEAGPFSPARLVETIVATAAYLAVFESLGYLIATPLYVVTIMLIHGGARSTSSGCDGVNPRRQRRTA